jgi:hypothetical protein
MNMKLGSNGCVKYLEAWMNDSRNLMVKLDLACGRVSAVLAASQVGLAATELDWSHPARPGLTGQSCFQVVSFGRFPDIRATT